MKNIKLLLVRSVDRVFMKPQILFYGYVRVLGHFSQFFFSCLHNSNFNCNDNLFNIRRRYFYIPLTPQARQETTSLIIIGGFAGVQNTMQNLRNSKSHVKLFKGPHSASLQAVIILGAFSLSCCVISSVSGVSFCTL